MIYCQFNDSLECFQEQGKMILSCFRKNKIEPIETQDIMLFLVSFNQADFFSLTLYQCPQFSRHNRDLPRTYRFLFISCSIIWLLILYSHKTQQENWFSISKGQKKWAFSIFCIFLSSFLYDVICSHRETCRMEKYSRK